MNEYAHKIRTVLFDAQVPDEETAGQWTSVVRNLDIDRFMDKTLKPFQENGQRWVIDRLEIDLGWIDIEQTDWIDRLKESIQEELNQQQVSQPLANYSRHDDLIKSARENGKLDQKLDRAIYWDLIRECLIKGVLPWQGDISLPLTDWLWKEWKENRLDTLARLQEVVAKNPQALARLLSWIRQTDPEKQESLLTEDPQERLLYRQFFQWIILVNPIWRQSAFRLDFFTQVWKTLLMYPLSKEERWTKLLDWVSEITYSNRLENPPSPGRLNSEFSAKIPPAFSFIRDWQERFLERWSNENLIPEQHAHAVKDLPDAKKSQRDVLTAQEEVLEKETLFISNAGIVLLNAGLIKKYLEKNGWVKDSEFINERAREKAIWWMEYLVFGEQKREEYHLALNKIMCGLDPAELLEHGPGLLTKREKQLANTLLKEILSHWSALKSTKVESLRESFVQRPGRLTKEGGSWQLHVAAKAYDILIEQIPWSFSIIKLPWMKNPLFTQWQTRI